MGTFIKSLTVKPKHEVAVVIPFYKAVLTYYEQISLDMCFKIFGNYPIIFIAPEDLSLNGMQFQNNNVEIMRFPKENFVSNQSYSRLLLSKVFYTNFMLYRYILIYQLDAFVFSDQLLHWCGLSYDYIGAPWHKSMLPFLYQLPLWARYDKLRRILGMSQYVGNGGFSLRKVKSFLRALNLIENKALNFHSNEDFFWSLLVPSYLPFFSIPDVDTALRFSFETNPQENYRRTGGKLPFGCHAWAKHDIEFWRPIFDNHGYKI
jgi:hypothetical protein